MRVAGCRVLVTGAGHGLGLTIATAFARARSSVIVTDIDANRVQESVASLTAAGLAACGYLLDVTAPQEVAAVRDRIASEHGPVDILVNNAGVVFGGAFAEVPLDRHLATVNVNLSGVVAMTHAFLPGLLTRPSAHIVNIASAAAVIALPFASTYAATKWAVLGFTESLSEELRVRGHRHVGVTAVCPGYISTGLFAGARPARLTRWLTPVEVANAVIRAVETGREFVLLPGRVRLLYSLCSGLPRTWFRAICRLLGVSTSMVNWTGRQPPAGK